MYLNGQIVYRAFLFQVLYLQFLWYQELFSKTRRNLPQISSRSWEQNWISFRRPVRFRTSCLFPRLEYKKSWQSSPDHDVDEVYIPSLNNYIITVYTHILVYLNNCHNMKVIIDIPYLLDCPESRWQRNRLILDRRILHLVVRFGQQVQNYSSRLPRWM